MDGVSCGGPIRHSVKRLGDLWVSGRFGNGIAGLANTQRDRTHIILHMDGMSIGDLIEEMIPPTPFPVCGYCVRLHCGRKLGGRRALLGVEERASDHAAKGREPKGTKTVGLG